MPNLLIYFLFSWDFKFYFIIILRFSFLLGFSSVFIVSMLSCPSNRPLRSSEVKNKELRLIKSLLLGNHEHH